MRIAKAVLDYLKLNEVDYVFGIPAGTVSPLYDAMNDVAIRPIVAKNEAGAAYMAARYASMSKKLGVCIVAGGVGINNAINGVADAMRAKAPMLIISGYVHRWQIGKGALQELDTKEILRPITKYSETILDENKVLSDLERAIRIALTPPRGPVHISIPIDVQLCNTEECLPEKIRYLFSQIRFDFNIMLNNAIQMISNHKQGLILVGKGCRGYSRQVMELSEHLQWPIITTPQAKGIVYGDFELNLGNYGFSSTDAAAKYVEEGPATCVLVLGSSLGESATCNFGKSLFKDRKVIHVDWDAKELGKVFETDIKMQVDLSLIIPDIIANTPKSQERFIKPEINEQYTSNYEGLSIRLFLEKITEIMPPETCYVSDLGEYMNFLFKYLHIPKGGNFEINLNYAAMGSGIAGAIGVALVEPPKPIAVFAGDGSFFMNGTEILTAKEYKLPIVYFIINNAMLGYVEHGHQYLYGRVLDNFKQERVSISDMMKAVGINSMTIESIKDMDGIGEFISKSEGPCVIELITDGNEPAPILDRLKALKKV